MMDGTLMVKLEVERMRQTILHAFTQREAQMALQLEEALDKAIANFDFEHEVAMQVNRLLPEIVASSIRDAVRRAMENGEMRGYLETLADQAVANFLSAYGDKK